MTFRDIDMEKPLTLINATVFLAIGSGLAMIALSGWPSADDFCNIVAVSDEGLFRSLVTLYQEWSGRVLDSAFLYSAFAMVDVPQLRWISFLLSLILLAIAFQVGSFVSGPHTSWRFPLSAFTFAAITYGLYPLLGQTVFWTTGGIVYLLPLSLALLWLQGMRRLLYGHVQPTRNQAAWLFLSIGVGNSIELVVPLVLTYAGLLGWIRWAELGKKARIALSLRVAGVLAGAILLAAAPGNYRRASASEGSFNFSPDHLVRHYASMFVDVAAAGLSLLVCAGMVLLVAISLRAYDRRGHSKITAWKPWESVTVALGALASLTPVLVAPPQFAPRNGLFLLVFVFIATLLLLPLCTKASNQSKFILKVLLAAAAMSLAFLATNRLLDDAKMTEAIRTLQIARHNELKLATANGVADPRVSPIGLRPPVVMHFIELSSDPNRWDNRCVAQYYGLKSVALDVKAGPR